jgi:hypothetical protein
LADSEFLFLISQFATSKNNVFALPQNKEIKENRGGTRCSWVSAFFLL